MFGHIQAGGAAPVSLVILEWMESEDGRMAIMMDDIWVNTGIRIGEMPEEAASVDRLSWKARMDVR